MGAKVTFDYSKAAGFIRENEMASFEQIANSAKEVLVSRSGQGNDFLGWIDLPVDYDKEEFARIKEAAKQIQSDSEVLLVIGIGGSYLGARAAIEFLRHGFYNNISKEQRKTPEIYFVGNNISSSYIQGLIDVIGDRDFSINMISKSGTTTEPAIAFRVFKEILEKKYGKEGAAKRIYATTDRAKGALKHVADEEGYATFVVPDDVGGRFSVLTAVGLLPIAVSGADIDQLMAGAASATFCTAKAKRWKFCATMNRASTMYPSGGSSCSARAKERTRRESFRHLWILPQTFILWDSLFRTVQELCLRRL